MKKLSSYVIGASFVVDLVACIVVSAPSFSYADNASRNREIEECFAVADKNHDGKLTLAEAQAGMPRVAAHFNDIDIDHKGYVTVAEIEAMADR
jgi:Ca2+-binding EF-hand superfamily protein